MTSPLFRCVVAILAAFALVACGGGGDGATDDAAGATADPGSGGPAPDGLAADTSGGDAGPAPITDGPCPGQAEAREAYPAGPYGTARGDVVADLAFVTPAGQPFRLSDLRRDGRTRLLVVSTAAEWCTACIEEQGALEELFAQHGDRGLGVLVTVFEDANFVAAEPSLADAWQRRFKLSFDVVADPDFVFEPYYNRDLTPMNMVLDACTMEILSLTTGWDRNLVESIIANRL